MAPVVHRKMNRVEVTGKEVQQEAIESPGTVFGAVSTDILEDVLLDLAKQNERYLKHLSEHAGCFKVPKVIEFIFLLAELWGIDNSARYQAVEIVDRFMITYIEENYKKSTESRKDKEKVENKNWTAVEAHLCETFVLRLVSCVQIASKLTFHCSVVNNNTVLKFMQSLGFTYKKEELLQSELTVLKTLQFQINVCTPFNFVEMLLEVLGHNGCLLSMKDLHEICLKILDLVYLLRNAIYESLLRQAVGNISPSDLQRDKFLPVKEDFMLLAVGIIAASAFILNQECLNQTVPVWANDVCTYLDIALLVYFMEEEAVYLDEPMTEKILLLLCSLKVVPEVVEQLSCITGIPTESIGELSIVILKHSIGSTTPVKH